MNETLSLKKRNATDNFIAWIGVIGTLVGIICGLIMIAMYIDDEPPPPVPTVTSVSVQNESLGTLSLEASELATTLITPTTNMPNTFSYKNAIQQVAWTMYTKTPASSYRGQFGIKLECTNGGWLMLLSNSDNDQLTLQYANHPSDSNPPQSLGSLLPNTQLPITLFLTKNTLTIGDTTYPINLTCDPYTLHLLTHLACEIPNPLADTNVSIKGTIGNLTITH